VSQPFKRGAKIPRPGKLDPEHKEFWVSNPWDIVREGRNLSAYERNRTYMNLNGEGFADVSYISGADSNGDGRGVVTADFRNNGQLDMVVRQVGGGPLLYFENQFPQKHYLKVSLRGVQSNRLGIGARLVAVVGGQRIVREMYPVNSFRTQAPCIAHFGLGDLSEIEQLTIHWPSGQVQTFEQLAGDRHLVVEEGKQGAAAIEAVVPGATIRP
jgi:enediyne biosynthesis protein E4